MMLLSTRTMVEDGDKHNHNANENAKHTNDDNDVPQHKNNGK